MNYLTDQAGNPLFPGYPMPVAPIVGIATGGSTTTLVDSTKAWIVNGLAGATVFITNAGTQYAAVVTSNTATTLTFAEISPTIAEGDFYFIIPVSVVQVAGSIPTLKTATIANGQSLSGAIDCTGKRIARIIMPAAWTAANLTFQTCATADGTYQDLYDGAGSEVVESVLQGKNTAVLNAIALSDLQYIKVRSGTSASPVAQGGDRTITLVLA